MKSSIVILSLFFLLLIAPCVRLQETDANSRSKREAWDILQAESCFETQGRDELSCRGRAMREGNALRALRLQS